MLLEYLIYAATFHLIGCQTNPQLTSTLKAKKETKTCPINLMLVEEMSKIFKRDYFSMKSEARSAHKELESCKSSKKDEIDDWDEIMRKVAEEAERMRLEEREVWG